MSDRFKGMSYEQASREAERLIADGWFKNFDELSALHEIMTRELKFWSTVPAQGWTKGLVDPRQFIG